MRDQFTRRTLLSEPIKNLKNYAVSNEPSVVNHVKKHLHKCYRVIRREREPCRIPKQLWNVWGTRTERLENLFVKVFVPYHQAPKSSILGDPGGTSQDDTILTGDGIFGRKLLQDLKSPRSGQIFFQTFI